MAFDTTPTAERRDLSDATLDALLLHGLTLDNEDPPLGILHAVQSELGVIAALLECSRPGIEFDIGDLAPVLESLGRRVAVAVEMMERARTQRATGAPV